ncbi:hypothetical protein N3K66_007051 [Trichothecium roseum]|uniref:Uncharacterized protein n=1 Tax=Trichothecium roseum TaxID=47278 RepID=A0ACC0UX41_9HYPO|nr:hypothetical protein N3K66_007051 [Trichothecium roseum]
MNSFVFSATRLARPVLAKATSTPRSFTTLTPLRPTLQAPTLAIRPRLTAFAPAAGTSAPDVVPRSAVTSNPMADMQVACGPRNTMNGHTRLVQKRRLGFLARRRTKDGRKILQRRLLKGRKKIAQ